MKYGAPMTNNKSAPCHDREEWEEIRVMVAKAGDVTPAGPIESVEYFGTIGVVLTINGEDYHRGIDAVISRKVRR
ncbi:hypothetical protein [Actinophytocola xanthii]|uniref:hypothetical protein n=1 Tax=Actinophytocola xanthii TaxID=1912961 RepID=UPI0011778740|nr:hypothetical protein [Actinophytocola xanthii]